VSNKNYNIQIFFDGYWQTDAVFEPDGQTLDMDLAKGDGNHINLAAK